MRNSYVECTLSCCIRQCCAVCSASEIVCLCVCVRFNMSLDVRLCNVCMNVCLRGIVICISRRKLVTGRETGQGEERMC